MSSVVKMYKDVLEKPLSSTLEGAIPLATNHAFHFPFFFHMKRMFPKIRFLLEQENPRLALMAEPYKGGKEFFQYYTNAIQLFISRETMAFHTSRRYKMVFYSLFGAHLKWISPRARFLLYYHLFLSSHMECFWSFIFPRFMHRRQNPWGWKGEMVKEGVARPALKRHALFSEDISMFDNLRSPLDGAYPMVMSNPYFMAFSVLYWTLYRQQKGEEKSLFPPDYEGRQFCILVLSNSSKDACLRMYYQLSRYGQVDFYGRVSIASHGPLPGEEENTSQWISRYRFCLCYENAVTLNYISEKLLHALFGGTIPIYSGGTNVGDYFNKRRFVCVDDYENADAVMQEIRRLNEHKAAYEEMISQPIFTSQNLSNIARMQHKMKGLSLRIFFVTLFFLPHEFGDVFSLSGVYDFFLRQHSQTGGFIAEAVCQ